MTTNAKDQAAEEGTSKVLRLKGPKMYFPYVFKKDKYDRYSANFAYNPGKFPLGKVMEVLSDDSKREAGLAAIKKGAAAGDEYLQIVNAIFEVSQAKWKTKWLQVLKSLIAKDDIALRNGDNKPDLAGYPGNYILSAVNQNRPTLLDRHRNDIDANSGLLYSGCHPIAVVEVWAQDNPAKGWRRINCQLQGLQHFKDGERVGGGRIAKKDEFEDLGDSEETTEGDDLVGGGGDGPLF